MSCGTSHRLPLMAKSVAIGLDGAAWHLLDPMLGAGAMPRLAALKAKGAWGTLTSTIPTYTPPAWTSAATGVNPGRHGIYGFVAGNAQSERQELVHSGMIKAPAIWEIANEQGARAGIYNLPLTYPPRPESTRAATGSTGSSPATRRANVRSSCTPG